MGGAREDQAAGVLNGFEGVALDAEAMESIQAALEACAARARALDSARDKGGMAAIDADEDDPDEPFVRVHHGGPDYRGELLPPVELEDVVPFGEDTHSWRRAGDEVIDWVPQVVEAAPERKGKRKGDSGSGPE